MLFPWYIKYPNQNDEILNLDWILSTIDNLVNEVANFVSLNTIKYADPIQWNITTQYEKNTVVIDPITGSAYISTKPVPAGVGLNNTDYWNVIFTLDVISANKNITLRDDANNILATFESEVDDWLLWQGTLYIVTRTIEIGQSYVKGYNIERYTVERFLKEYITNLKTYVDTTIGDLDDLDTTDKTNLVAAINELLTTLTTVAGDLEDLDTTDKTNLVAAINEVLTTLTTVAGDLDELDTTDKDNLVAAINEVNGKIKPQLMVNVRDFGAVGNANYFDKTNNTFFADAGFNITPTSDVTAFENAITYAIDNNIHTVFIPKGNYYLPNKKFNLSDTGILFTGEDGSNLISTGIGTGAFITVTCSSDGNKYFEESSLLKNINIKGNYFHNNWATTNVIGILFEGAWIQHKGVSHIGVSGFNIGIKCTEATESRFNDISIILCDTGLWFEGGTYNPMPAWLTNSTIELCSRGIRCVNGGYSTLFVTDCGLSGGSQLYLGKCSIKFTNCRFEWALDECCDTNGNPVPPIRFIADSGTDAISGASFSNCQFLFTASGGNVAKLMFWNGTVYTRNSDLDYVIDNANSYVNSNATVRFSNCQILTGSKGFKYMVQQYYARSRTVYSGMDIDMYSNRCIAMGNSFVEQKLDKYSADITKSGNTYVIAQETTLSFDIPKNATGISVHVEPLANMDVTITAKAKDDFYSEVTATRTVTSTGDWTNQTLCIPFRSNCEKVYITLAAGTINSSEHHMWFEYVF